MKRVLMLVFVLCAAHAAWAAPTAGELIQEAVQTRRGGDLDGALETVNKAVAADPKGYSAYDLRAQILEERREFEKAAADRTKVIDLAPAGSSLGPEYSKRGEDWFRIGRFKEAVADFDQVIKIDPKDAPYLWTRGIALYYAGDFEGGAKQFESHKTVNPNDVENAVWHYLCVARASGIEKARLGLIPIQGDPRVPMMQVHAMFAGQATAKDVLHAAEAGDPADLKRQRFYAHLYIGLFEEAAGNASAAKEHLLLAADKYASNDYMGDVARVHAAILRRPAKPTR